MKDTHVCVEINCGNKAARSRNKCTSPLDRPSVPQIKGETNELISPMKRGEGILTLVA